MTNGLEYISLEWSLEYVQDQKDSELEGLGFNLSVAPSHIIVSLISEIRDQRFRDDLVVKTAVDQGQQGSSKLYSKKMT